jgi:hypothetical protein
MKCYCGMTESECPYDVNGVCHNEIDATECGGNRHFECSRCKRFAEIDNDSGWCQACLWSSAN